jgi:predicted nucleic acid-binding protein
MLRAVLDPNVVLAADRSTNTLSPNKEIINRWANSEFTWLVTEDIAAEYAEKLLEKGNAPAEVEAFIAGLFLVADLVEIRFFHFRHYPVDSDDTIFSFAPSMAMPRIS